MEMVKKLALFVKQNINNRALEFDIQNIFFIPMQFAINKWKLLKMDL